MSVRNARSASDLIRTGLIRVGEGLRLGFGVRKRVRPGGMAPLRDQAGKTECRKRECHLAVLRIVLGSSYGTKEFAGIRADVVVLVKNAERCSRWVGCAGVFGGDVRRIEALEHAPGLVLFERNTRGFQPTPEAQALTLAAQVIETGATDFAGKARRLIAARSRTIKITADKDAVNHRFSLVVEAFTRAHGDVSFDFLADDDFVDIAAGEADIALRVAR